MNDEMHLKLLKALENNPTATQRELSRELGVSLGKANYCLKALVDKGAVKANNFKNSKNKLAYAYLLTPSGIEEKTRLTARFLKRKMAEYELLKKEIEQLRQEVATAQSTEN
ncbi:MarR family EPS-associated transcriptional regulator [Thioalbus denitrificans]|jgi:EPS-associated MarR family transcriptional regulator|uniref:EPS-associated MarR family transcriptional regulator n=1 Tax=Thioalbus denitrificans TaxID=547122 RepID=A0A369CIK7_9GAMM|nr:MarR family EPS-associated transcriptional regulator [Thioalbus denitrificans]RCX32267.1 EPS-associated MarR family transcriptional regulator [Thioalbus denitrificans]